MPPTAIGRTMNFVQMRDDAGPGRGLVAAVHGHVLIDERRAEEVDEQRHEQPPRQQAAGEVQRAELGADDVADAEVRRA